MPWPRSAKPLMKELQSHWDSLCPSALCWAGAFQLWDERDALLFPKKLHRGGIPSLPLPLCEAPCAAGVLRVGEPSACTQGLSIQQGSSVPAQEPLCHPPCCDKQGEQHGATSPARARPEQARTR